MRVSQGLPRFSRAGLTAPRVSVFLNLFRMEMDRKSHRPALKSSGFHGFRNVARFL